ncbi:hypothetical protein [Paraburkholderia lycopersici]|uniref:hypothetical protein n=1 Tax=Paraburkholderia lycopersici TaxID=416944 RepID=UPI001161355D|nr:hypothetical protein [Paraburkholderia lycopersici]
MDKRRVKTRQGRPFHLPPSARVDESLRLHLCFFALRTAHGRAFHLGTIVRTMFASFYLYEAGYGSGDASIFSEADEKFVSISLESKLDGPFSLRADAESPTARLLELYDRQLETAPVASLVDAHRRAQMNLRAAPQEQLTIGALIARAKVGSMTRRDLNC